MTDEEIIEALKPFAWLGQWFFARNYIPDDTPVFKFEGLNHEGALTRGDFKKAHLALCAFQKRLSRDDAEEAS